MATILCALEDIPPSNGLECRVNGPEGMRELVLFRAGHGVVAFLNACPHQGRSLSFAPGEFLLGSRGELICPHHGACFDLPEGNCVSGPCQGSALTVVPLRLEGANVLLDSGD